MPALGALDDAWGRLRTFEQVEALSRQPGVRRVGPLTGAAEVERHGDVLNRVTGTGSDAPPERW